MTMMLWLLVGTVAGLGLLGLLLAAVGTPPNEKLPGYGNAAKLNYPAAKQLLYPGLAAIVTLVATGWIVAALIAAVAAWVYPINAARTREQARHVALTEAVGAWVEQLRDAIVSGGGIEAPLRRTAETGPELLRPQLRELAVALDTHDTAEALTMFARDVGHHTVDMLVAAYVIAASQATRGLPDLLGAIAETARAEVSTFQKVEAGRKKIKSSSRMIMGTQLGIIAVAVIFGRQFLTVYDTFSGQMVLLGVGVFILASQFWISKLSVVRRPPRFFAADDTPSFDDVAVDQAGRVVLN